MKGYWVGKIGIAHFVFDKEIQPVEADKVTLFSKIHDRPVKLSKNVVRQRIARATDLATIADARSRYQNWRQFYRSELAAINDSAEFSTKNFLDATQSALPFAFTNGKAICYGCNSSLTGKRGKICAICFWNTCKCGTCGCGYTSRHEIGIDSASTGRLGVRNGTYADPDAGKDAEFEERQIREEARDYSWSLTRSDSDGWFYSDDDQS